MHKRTLAISAALAAALCGAAFAGITYKTVEELSSPAQQTMKLTVLQTADSSRAEMPLSNLGAMGGSAADQTAQAQQGVQGAQAQMMNDQMAKMAQYMDMIKDPKQKAALQQQMAMMKQQMTGGPQAQAANKANNDVIAQGAQKNTEAMAGSSMFSLEDLKGKVARRYMTQPGTPKEYDENALFYAPKSAGGWETTTVNLTQDKPKEAALNGVKATLYVLKFKYLLSHAKSKQSSDFAGEIKYWMDPAREKEFGAQWRAYASARRKAGIGGISIRENMDTCLYSISTDDGRAQLDKALDAMPGVPLKVEYSLEGKGLKYRLAGVMRKMAAPDTGSDLADATEEAASGSEAAAEGPADASAEKPWRLAVSFADLKTADAPAAAFKVPDGYAKKKK